MKSFLSLFYFILFVSALHSQNVELAKQIVDTISSKNYYGRGYTNEGANKTASFIKDEFIQAGVKALNEESYFQDFNLNSNTFSGELHLKIGKKSYALGSEYIPDPISGSYTGKLKSFYISKDNIDSKEVKTFMSDKNYDGYVFLIDLRGIEDKEEKKDFESLSFYTLKTSPTIIIDDEKLTWGASTFQIDNLLIKLNDSSSKFKSGEKVIVDIESKELKDIKTKNVLGYIKGTKPGNDSTIVFTAHYDHLGQLGNEHYIPGASDNASGIAMLIDLANYYSRNPLQYDMVFIAFSGEELGLLGSKYFVEHPLIDLKKIKFLLNIDIMGGGEDGLGVVNGSVFQKEMELLEKINKEQDLIKKFKVRGEAANSDHYFFSQAGVPCFFIYTMGGTTHYHDIFDTSESLTWGNYENVFILIKTFLNNL